MKKLLGFALLTLVLVACGTDSQHFKLGGRLLHMNQGEFYVYSPDGIIEGIDTIKVQGGRFSFEIPCATKGTLVIVFPNFSEQPVFAEPGTEAEIDGDASHLKEIKVKGNNDNKLMTSFRQHVLSFSPPETAAFVKQFVADHPESLVSVYLVNRYFLRGMTVDYAEAGRLIDVLSKSQPDNAYLKRIERQVKGLGLSAVGSMLPSVAATDVNGKPLSVAVLRQSPVSVVYSWATWNYESTDVARELRRLRQQSNGKLQVVGICLDASLTDCRNTMKRDSVAWPTVCDGEMFDSKLVRQWGLLTVPDNILIYHGRIVARGLSSQELVNRVKALL